MAGMLSVGLTSHRPCVDTSVVYPLEISRLHEMSRLPAIIVVCGTLYLNGP